MASGKLLRILEDLSRIPSPGPAPGFTYVHICRALLAVGDAGPVGRIELSRRLGLGEGAVRTVIRHLTRAGLVSTEKEGCVLARRGLAVYKALRSKVSPVVLVDARQLALDKVSAAVLVRSVAGHLKRGIEQRDAAVRAGATGACTLVVRRGNYVMPMGDRDDWSLPTSDPLRRTLEQTLHPKERDVVSIVSAPAELTAENGAVAAALTLIE